jgi:hypothetical protein
MVIQMTEALIRVEYYSTDLLITPLGIRAIQIPLSEMHVRETQGLHYNRVTITIDNNDHPSHHETKKKQSSLQRLLAVK